MTYRYTIDQEGYMCIKLKLYAKNKFSVRINGEEVYNDNVSLPYIAAVGHVNVGDVVELRMTCKSKEDSKMNIRAAMLDDTVFRNGYDILSASTLELTSFENTHVEGTIHCDRAGLLYTSIPQDGNWTAEVDGKPAEIVEVGSAMIGLALTEGSHTVTFTYRNAAFSLGWKITLGCFLIFVCLIFLFYPNLLPHKKGKYER